jgi:hypothetical protein
VVNDSLAIGVALETSDYPMAQVMTYSYVSTVAKSICMPNISHYQLN